MTPRAGFVWGTPQHFNRFIEESGIACELITPQMLAAPFFRTTLNCLIIPTGFANPAYSNLIFALRASSSRIIRFVENGGNLLVFGAAMDKPDAYDWLPFRVHYAHDCHPRAVRVSESSCSHQIIEDYDASRIECDGTFTSYDALCTGFCGESAVILERTVGKGTIVVTSIHEFPSRSFIQQFCRSGQQVVF
ncbi:MAG: hypothetical protein CVV32_05640 [Methanomicrobiales archaeon HGW-Methanomicrobiales-3]|jgi:glutamine amidotransferase-like uncharacterized protein|nr:MAG: hypothetical protein CVV32_05640 [Methanomicrobiales archaeon HGW-Methanomicrobiales-3]